MAHTTLNINDRWMNTLSRRLHNAYGNRISIVNETIAGNRVVNPVTANSAAGPAAVDRLDRDVLGLSGLTYVIWMEGINDSRGRPHDRCDHCWVSEYRRPPACQGHQGLRRDTDLCAGHQWH